MKQYEADLIAKGIRNLTCPLSDKIDCIKFICTEMYNLDQFFNVKRFQTIAEQELPKDFYKKNDKWVTSITYKGNKEDKP
jgi:hypothetical protein